MKFLTKHAKFIYILFGVLIGAMIIASCFYATEYAHIHVFYSLENGKQVVTSTDENSVVSLSNNFLFKFFEDGNATGYGSAFTEEYSQWVLNFQNELNKFNSAFVAWEFVALVCFAFLFVLSNHSRRIYYKSNLIGGILIPLVVVIINIVLMLQNLAVMGIFNSHSEFYNIVSVLQDPTKNVDASKQTSLDAIRHLFSCDTSTFILFTVFFIVIIAYAVFCAIFAILKYKATAEERNKILEKVVTNND